MMPHDQQLDIYLEISKKKVFACAFHWPGWCRSGKDEESAIQALQMYGRRYASVIKFTDLAFPLPHKVEDFTVIERVPGNASTDFGVPDVPIPGDAAPLSTDELMRGNKILKACWRAFNQAIQAGEGKQLRKGPRGGGRELDEIVSHVAHAEVSYLGRLGWSGHIPEGDDLAVWMDQVHSAILSAMQSAARGEFPTQGPRGGKRWPLGYFVRRIAWHVLDHTWEIEDRII